MVKGGGRARLALAAAVATLALPASALAGHGLELLDHSPPAGAPPAAPNPGFQSGGRDAKWELIGSIPTGNPHTDVDFFTQGGNTYASVGTLGSGANGGGQTIIQLTEGDQVRPRFVSAAPTASCLSDPSETLGLQHDVEAAPKGNAILNTDVLAANRTNTQLIVDATDAPGRCHDQAPGGLPGSPRGGLEIIDVTDPANPVTIGMTSHIGEAHTVNVDPKRPHIAYAVTSDAVSVSMPSESNPNQVPQRQNEIDDDDDEFDLDGFEVVDMSSCMNFAPGTSLEDKRARCRPQVWRYRYPDLAMSQGHTLKTTTYGCHELEIYPSDRLTCGSGQAMIELDMRAAFDNNGTPTNFNDDRPRGTPLPCRERESASAPPLKPAAPLMVIDCVDGQGSSTEDLAVPEWLAAGAPSLAGVEWVGSAFHQGRGAGGAATPAFDSSQDIDFNHEAELTHSGAYVISTDERGGGVSPPGASCSPGADNRAGNGGLHVYRNDRLLRRAPNDANDAFGSYALTPQGQKAIYRAPVRTQPQPSLCTAHVFQQIPGQNRIFMGWYSQGTQVLDFVEHANGRFEWREAGFFIPVQANEWVSHVFKVERERDGKFTYYGAAADFNLAAAGRNAVDIFKVTLPAPPAPRGFQAGVGRGFDPRQCVPAPARASRNRISSARIGTGAAAFRRRFLPRSRRGRVTRYCTRNRNGRFYVGSGRRGRINFVASTNRRIGTRRLRPGRRLPRAQVAGVRRFAPTARGLRNVFIASRRGSRRFMYGVRGRRVTFIAAVSSGQASNRRDLARRLRALRLVPRR
jgi:hypothetical protein